jgi:hypothetical protein
MRERSDAWLPADKEGKAVVISDGPRRRFAPTAATQPYLRGLANRRDAGDRARKC